MWAIYYFGDVSTENRIRSLMMKEKLDLLGPCVSHLQTIIENIDSIINIINDLQLLTSKRAQTKVKTDELPVWVHSQLGQPGYDASPDTLLGLIALEQLQLSRRQVYVRLCVRCGRVFDTKNGNAKFCSNPACKECPLNTIYDARSIAYQKWITDQKRSDLSCFGEDAAKVKEELDYYYDCWEQRAKDTIKESFVGLYIILAKFSFCLSAAKGCILYLYLKYF